MAPKPRPPEFYPLEARNLGAVESACSAALTFLDNHRDQLQFHKLRGVDMDVATGAVEGAIDYIIGRRLDGSMMRWSPARADHVLALRCVQYNGHWKRSATAVEHAHAARGSP